jgi:hypothetical protein
MKSGGAASRCCIEGREPGIFHYLDFKHAWAERIQTGRMDGAIGGGVQLAYGCFKEGHQRRQADSLAGHAKKPAAISHGGLS